MKTCAAILLASMCAALPALAQLSATLNSSVQNSAGGQSLVFCGTLQNTSTSAGLYLNDVEFSVSGAPGCVVAGTNAFYANVPGILCPGESYTGEVFSVALSGSAPAADYNGTVTLQGGADIFAAGNLASEGFTVLSPAVTLVATGSDASEVGPAPGTFTITRTGGTEIALPVAFTVGGTAVNGSDYQAIATSGTIAAGASSTAIEIIPIPNDIAQPDPAAILTLAPSTYYNLGADISDTVTIQVKPADAWRYQYFGALANSPQAADTADWSGSGIVNLTAFALNIDPLSPSPALLPMASVVSNDLTLTYAPNPAATDVSYTVEGSTDLINWSSANVQATVNPASAPPGSVTYRYVSPSGASGQAFLRLRVTRTDE